MTGKEFLNSLANGKADILQLLLGILAEMGSQYCVIGGPCRKCPTRRIEAQHGRFTYSGHAKNVDENSLDRYKGESPWNILTSYRIPKGETTKGKIRKTLAALTIHRGKLFPDLDGYAKYLAEGGL